VDTAWGDLFLFAEDEQRLAAMLTRLCADAKARAAFLVDQNGRLLAASGDSAGLDTTSLASLVAGSIAATGGLARLIGERAFSGLFHEGERSHLYVTVVSEGLILVVSFDRSSSAGLVRFRVRRASEEIGQVIKDVRSFLDSASVSLKKVESVLLEQQSELTRTFSSLGVAVENLARFSREIAEEPSAILRTRKDKK